PRTHGEDRDFLESYRPPERLRPLTTEDLPPLLREQFSETNGKVGTPVYVQIDRTLSRSRGESLLRIADLLEGVRDEHGQVVPNASRATVFAEMIRSMTGDAPRAVLVALGIVIIVTVIGTRTPLVAAAVLGSLALGVWLTLGAAAFFQVRLN